MSGFNKISSSLQEKIFLFSEKRKERVLKKIEKIGENIKQLIPTPNNDLEIKEQADRIRVSNNENSDFDGLTAKDCYLGNKKIGFYGYEEGYEMVILKFMYSSNKKVSAYLGGDYEKNMLEQADISREYYYHATNMDNKYFYNTQNISLDKYKYIGSSIFFKFIEEILDKNIEKVLIKSLITSVGFYIKVLDFLKREGLVTSYEINDSSNPMEKSIEVKLSNPYIINKEINFEAINDLDTLFNLSDENKICTAFDPEEKLSDDDIDLVYGYFKAYIAEALGNSLDADATKGNLRISFDAENKDLLIVLTDNGKGENAISTEEKKLDDNMNGGEGGFFKIVEEASQNRFNKSFTKKGAIISFKLNTDFFIKYAIEHKDDVLKKKMSEEIQGMGGRIDELKKSFDSETLKMYKQILKSPDLDEEFRKILEKRIAEIENN